MKKIVFLVVSIVLVATLSACAAEAGDSGNELLTASGTISANAIKISSEIGGKVVDVNVKEGDTVSAGDVLFQVDDELIQAQYDQAKAAADAARTSVDAAKAQLASAEVQQELALQGARLQEMGTRNAAWLTDAGDEIELPSWYYEKGEQLAALEAEVDKAKAGLDEEQANLEKELDDASNGDFIALEKSLAEVQTALHIADITLQQAKQAGDENLTDIAQEAYDSALADLDAIQLTYDRMLSTSAAEDVLSARAHVAVARARYENALDQLASLQSGEDSLQVKAAAAGVTQAQAVVTQAEANLKQAEASLSTLEIQLEKTAVRASEAGTVLSMNLAAGELVGAGSILITLGQLDQVELTVYVSESQFGKISLGQEVTITADSFPNKTFDGVVSYIADQAEFTPRNVQTVEGRKTTVYAVKISVPNPDQSLKPGMPVDVGF